MEVATIPDNLTPADCFVADLASTFVKVPDGLDVKQRWTHDGNAWRAPPPLPPPLPVSIEVSSRFNPDLNGTYAADPLSLQTMQAIYVSLKLGDGFPGGGDTLEVADLDGKPHTFDRDAFVSLYLAVRDYVHGMGVSTRQGSEPPSNKVTIA